MILDSLPDPVLAKKVVPKQVQRQIDLMLLALESVELGGAEKMLQLAKQLEIDDVVANRVVLWRMRCTNPWRRSHVRRHLQMSEAKALTAIIHFRARQLTVPIRNLLMAEQQVKEKGLSPEYSPALAQYLERFRAHFRARMNPRRAGVAAYDSPEKLNLLALELLQQLLFCTGTLGLKRLWFSLFDGEVV